jgi:ABC-type nitrate/sulfonate/bicarbonate transport system substrate-binding protein
VAVTAVMSGQAQATANSADTPLLARKAGANLLIVANIADKGPAEIVVAKKVLDDNGISLDRWQKMSYAERTKYYKGLRWAILGPGGLTDLLVRATIRGAGYDPDRDTKILPVGGSLELYAALRAGLVDAMVQSPPASQLAIAEGYGVKAGDLHEVSKDFDEFSYQVIAVEAGWAERNAQTTRKLVRGIARACDYVRTADPKQVAAELQSHGYFAKIDPAILSASVRVVASSIAKGGRVTKRSIDNMVKFYVDAGNVKAAEVPSTEEGVFWTTKYLPQN